MDLDREILYWCDARFDTIEALDLVNLTRTTIAKSPIVAHPFGLTTFGNYLFWTDWGKQSIKRINLETKDVVDMKQGISSLMGVEVFDVSRQQGMLSYKFSLFLKSRMLYLCRTNSLAFTFPSLALNVYIIF